jgi:hypothetical protein
MAKPAAKNSLPGAGSGSGSFSDCDEAEWSSWLSSSFGHIGTCAKPLLESPICRWLLMLLLPPLLPHVFEVMLV